MLRKICSLSGPASIMPHFPKIWSYFFSFIFDYYICQMYNIPTKKLQDGHFVSDPDLICFLGPLPCHLLPGLQALSSLSLPPTRQFYSRPCGSTAWGCSTQRTLAPFSTYRLGPPTHWEYGSVTQSVLLEKPWWFSGAGVRSSWYVPGWTLTKEDRG